MIYASLLGFCGGRGGRVAKNLGRSAITGTNKVNQSLGLDHSNACHFGVGREPKAASIWHVSHIGRTTRCLKLEQFKFGESNNIFKGETLGSTVGSGRSKYSAVARYLLP